MEKILSFIKANKIAIALCVAVIVASAGGAYYMVTTSVKELRAVIAKTSADLKVAKTSEESAKAALHQAEEELAKAKEESAKAVADLAVASELSAGLEKSLAEAKAEIQKLGAKKTTSSRGAPAQPARGGSAQVPSSEERRLLRMQSDIARREREIKADKERLAEERRNNTLRLQRELREREWAAEQQKAIYR